MLISKKQADSSRRKYKKQTLLVYEEQTGAFMEYGDSVPDFTTIAMDQSLNWCKYSIPVWARFIDQKNYLPEYAVVGVKTSVIRYSNKYNMQFEDLTWTVKHKPIEVNYSHCEIVQLKDKLTKDERRAIRMTLKHKSRVYLRPDQKSGIFRNLWHRFKFRGY